MDLDDGEDEVDDKEASFISLSMFENIKRGTDDLYLV